MGILNSRLLTFRFKFIGKLKSGGILEYFENSVSKLPIRRIDFADDADREYHDNLIALVDQILLLNSQALGTRTTYDRTALSRQIDMTDRKIDYLVYELYGLTEEEIDLVEKSVK